MATELSVEQRWRRLGESLGEPNPPPLTLANRFDLAAAGHQDRPYVITDERAFLTRRSRRLTVGRPGGAMDYGITPGEQVAMIRASCAMLPIAALDRWRPAPGRYRRA